jgi:ribosomal protein S18 acetylase RimI-like enzyme
MTDTFKKRISDIINEAVLDEDLGDGLQKVDAGMFEVGDAAGFMKKGEKDFLIYPSAIGPSGPITSYSSGPQTYLITFSLMDMSHDDDVGQIGLGVTEDNRPYRLINIEINPKFRGKGYAQRVLSILLSLAPENTLIINDIKKSAVPFWEKLGAEFFTDDHKDKKMISARLSL